MPKQSLWFILILLSVSLQSLGAESESFGRWAILAEPYLRESGVSDLLTAQLLAEKVELVEREQLVAVTREIELSKLLGADGTAQRLKVGQLTKADVLVLLSVVENDKKKFVKLVISECRYGSRLRLEHFLLGPDQPDKLADAIASAAIETRAKFVRGVEQIVVVSPFLSKNLTHEFDHLQFGFAALLGQRLSEQPGVAVLEIEEARALAEELARAGSPPNRRLVSQVIDGEFEVGEPGKTEPSGAVRFVVRIRDGSDQERTVQHAAATLAKASAWLTESLPDELNAMPDRPARGNAKSIGRTEQRAALIRRADQFTAMSAFSQAAALREAAALLDSNDWEQRVMLIADLTYRLKQIYSGNRVFLQKRLREDAEFKRRLIAELHALISGIEGHTEQILASGVLNVSEGSHLVDTGVSRMTRPINDVDLELGLRPAYRDYVWRCLSRVRQLDPERRQGSPHPVFERAFHLGQRADKATLIQQQDTFIVMAFSVLTDSLPERHASVSPSRYDDTNTIGDLSRLFDDILRPDVFSASVLMRLTRFGVPSLVISNRIPVADVIALLEQWRDRRGTLLEFYGRAGLLALKAHGGIKTAVNDVDLKEADWLTTFLSERRKSHPQETTLTPLGTQYVSEIRQKLEKRISQPLPGQSLRPARQYLSGVDPFPRLAFEPLDVQANWTMLGPCGAGRDLVWSWESIGVMTAPGHVRTIATIAKEPAGRLLAERDSFCSVAWDGELIWAASSQSGVRIFNLDGDGLGHFVLTPEEADSTVAGSDRLPPVEKFTKHETRGFQAGMNSNLPLWIHPLEPGRCFVAGRFGKDRRRWFGVIERQPLTEDRSWKFTRWHQLTKPKSATGSDDELDVIFSPTYLARFSEPDDSRRWLLIGRDNQASNRPLGFDIKTGQVMLFPKSLSIPRTALCEVALAVGDNRIFVGEENSVRWDCRDTSDVPSLHKLSSAAGSEQPSHDVIRQRRLWSHPYQLLSVGEWLYQPGTNWRRINTRTWDVEELTPSRVSMRYEFENYGVSAHYGLVAWNHGDSLCRVHVDWPAEKERPLSWLYPFVPIDQPRLRTVI